MTDDKEKREMGKMANRTEVTFCKKKNWFLTITVSYQFIIQMRIFCNMYLIIAFFVQVSS
jgi:hypothetical protein